VLRDRCPDNAGANWRRFRHSGGLRALGISAAFCAVAILIVMLREDVVPYRPGQWVSQAILSRVDFSFHDKARYAEARQNARDSEPRIYKLNGDPWGDLHRDLDSLPDRLAGHKISDLPKSLQDALEATDHGGDLNSLYLAAEAKPESPLRVNFQRQVQVYISAIEAANPIIVPEDQYREERQSVVRHDVAIELQRKPKEDLYPATAFQPDDHQRMEDLRDQFKTAARIFPPDLAGRIVAFTMNTLKPSFLMDSYATTEAQNRAANQVPSNTGDRHFVATQPLIEKGSVITERDWQILRAEKEAFVASLGMAALESKLGLAGMVVLIFSVLSYYVGRFQPRIIRNPFRAVALGSLLIAMLLLAQLAAIGTGPLYVFGIAPTILVAMILAVAYDQRFAIGVATMHGVLVTAALDQGIGFFLIIWVGVLTCGFLLDEVRSRSKLVEVGGLTALAMILATIAAGAVTYERASYILDNAIYTGAAGLAVGFAVLGILPFIEKAFGITTGMTLLELADASQPLLRRLALEAPGTYNHSLQVAVLAEAAAEVVGADALLCRVAAYYHDIGKINKADYFVENQGEGHNRHIHLTPSMSFHIITGHVKDGVALAREYNLPPEVVPFIQQHHGTTLIEYFYEKAKKRHDQLGPDEPEISEQNFRYAGPKPKTREVAILMLADAAESASRTLEEPTPVALEKLVRSLAMKRLMDGQFEECDLTLRDLATIEKSLVKTLAGIYHGRIAYPSAPQQAAPTGGSAASPAA
jgi:putative nucleotidyltransferase with HDIG domain